MNVFIERRYSWETRNFQTESLPGNGLRLNTSGVHVKINA